VTTNEPEFKESGSKLHDQRETKTTRGEAGNPERMGEKGGDKAKRKKFRRKRTNPNWNNLSDLKRE